MSVLADGAFPAGIPAPSIWYLLLYALTMLLHAAFMSYVLCGAVVLALAGVRSRLGSHGSDGALASCAHVLKDWLPAAISGAITAGIAPLLFVQILYQQEYYTANLLSFHRWMAILPVLIAAIYMLYFVKAKRLTGRPRVQAALTVAVAACMLFVAWSWVENHLLSLDRAVWAAQYAEGRMVYASGAIGPRFAFFLAASVPVWALLTAAQLRAGASGTTAEAARGAMRPLSIAALAGLAVSAVLALPVLTGPLGTAHVTTTPQSGWSAVLFGSTAATALGWILIARARRLAGPALAVAVTGCVVSWTAILAIRESTRWSIAGRAISIERHSEVGTTAGLVVFVVFLAIGLAATVWIWRRVARALVR